MWHFQHANEDVEKMILGNKCDMEEKRVVSKERGESVSTWCFFCRSMLNNSRLQKFYILIPWNNEILTNNVWTFIFYKEKYIHSLMITIFF